MFLEQLAGRLETAYLADDTQSCRNLTLVGGLGWSLCVSPCGACWRFIPVE